MGKQKTIIFVLVILLVVALAYIGYLTWQSKQATAFQSGAQYGYQQAVVEIMGRAVTCEQVPLYAGNKTLSVVAVQCLKAPASSSTGNSPQL